MKRSVNLIPLLLAAIAIIGGCSTEQSSVPVPAASAAGATPALTAVAVPDPDRSFRGVRVVSKDGKVINKWARTDINLFQPVRTGQNTGQQMFIYRPGSMQPELLAENGSLISWPAPEWTGAEPPYGNDYGNDVLYADRLLNDEIFAVKGNRTLYLVNTVTGEARKLYTAKHPIYGLAASKDNSRAALLVASEPYIGPNADLIILDREGEQIYSKPKASVQGHSDGFLFIYPMAWTNDTTLAVPANG